MRFLIDECLHTSLVDVAHQVGFAAAHVNHMGMGGLKDWQLMDVILREEYTFVTNNRTHFVALYSRHEVHPGLVVIVPNVAPAQQRLLFQAALAHIGRRDLVDAVIEVEQIDAVIRCSEYPLP
jgi:predicted nuclease of predicted toxin-antitoxin system